MRLIDADALLEHYACGDVTGIPEEDIKLAPTIDAILVEWIEEYIEEKYNEIEYYEIGGVNCNYSGVYALENLIDNWRKENESDSTN